MGIAMAVRNISTVVGDAEVTKALPALQHQANYHFAPFWNAEARLHFFPKDQSPPATMWLAEIRDDNATAVFGEHAVDPGHDLPDISVGAAADKDAGIEWTVTFSHELLESLADPWINACAQYDGDTFYALEVCDPVQGEPCAYQIDGIWVSDFVTPAWFAPPGSTRGYRQYDFQNHLTAPFEIAEYGYASIYTGGKWTQQQMTNGKLEEVDVDGSEGVGPGRFRGRPSQHLRRRQAKPK
jgi:hypothetical protein